MASKEIPEAEHARTVSHMNNDHPSDLSLYLRHYNGLSAADAAGAELRSLDLAGMTIRSASGTHRVVLNPPMASWSDRRARLIDMAITARAGLEAPDPLLADVFVAPAVAPDLLVAAGVAFYFASLAAVRGGLVAPGSPAWDLLLAARFPGGPGTFRWLVDVLAVPVLLIHVAEAWHMHASRLKRHGVVACSPAWFLWVSCTFFEGVCAFRRFDRLVLARKREAVEKEAKSH